MQGSERRNDSFLSASLGFAHRANVNGVVERRAVEVRSIAIERRKDTGTESALCAKRVREGREGGREGGRGKNRGKHVDIGF